MTNELIAKLAPPSARYTCEKCGDTFVIIADLGRGKELIMSKYIPNICSDCAKDNQIDITVPPQKTNLKG